MNNYYLLQEQVTVSQLIATVIVTVISTVAGIKAAATYLPGVDLFFSSKRTKKDRHVTCNFCPESEQLAIQNSENIDLVTENIQTINTTLIQTNKTLEAMGRILEETAKINKQVADSIGEVVFNAKVDKEVRKRLHKDE